MRVHKKEQAKITSNYNSKKNAEERERLRVNTALEKIIGRNTHYTCVEQKRAENILKSRDK